MVSNPRKVVVFWRKLHFLFFQKNAYSHKYINTIIRISKCFLLYCYRLIYYQKYHYTLFNMSTNRFFIIHISHNTVFIRPIGITTYLYNLYQGKNTIFDIFSYRLPYYLVAIYEWYLIYIT